MIMLNSKTGVKNRRNRTRRSAGFTMAELLIVVAIIGVLAGVSFIAVQTHQKSVTQLQYDTIAKEIFIAAQNHLTLARSENYRQTSDLSEILSNTTSTEAFFFGPDGNAGIDTIDDIRYFCSKDSNEGTAFEQILPFGSVEIPSGGSFIIRYQPIAARVLDVFYWTDGSNKYDANLGAADYSTLAGNAEVADKRKNYTGDGLVGWCGGADIVVSGAFLESPIIEVINEEMLMVKITDTNTSDANKALNPQLKLIVTGEASGAKMAVSLSLENHRIKKPVPGSGSYVYTVILDDITANDMHFADLMKETDFEFLKKGDLPVPFIPGENITIQAVAYSNEQLASVAYSGEWTTNSLFAEVSVDTDTTTTGGTTVTTYTAKQAFINNIRHLENLNDDVSGVDYSNVYFGDVIDAVQTADLDWSQFISKVKEITEDDEVSIYDASGDATKAGCFLPVNTNYALKYDGQAEGAKITETTGTGETAVTTTTVTKENHSIKGVVVDNADATGEGFVSIESAGVFGALTSATIRNLALIDTSVNLASDGDAGALAGSLVGCTVENVVAYDTPDFEERLTTATPQILATVTASNGDAGGLIGAISTKTDVTNCAAAVLVKSTNGDAGGLIGSVGAGTPCTVTGCYAGGHTIDSDINDAVIYHPENYNVTAGADDFAGGLIGDAGSATIRYCYSTCSATGAKVGGLIGKGTGTVSDSYCTGLVKSTADTPVEGAFAGIYTGKATDCLFFEIINERVEKDATGVSTIDYTYLYPVSGLETVDGITALDETAATYNAFSFDASVGDYAWQLATPYNDRLKVYYSEETEDGESGKKIEVKYILRTVGQLGQAVQPESETTEGEVITKIPADFVATHYGDWPAPEIFVVNTAS